MICYDPISILLVALFQTFNIPDDKCSWKQYKRKYYLATLGKLQDRDHRYRDAEQNKIVDEG